MQAVVMLYGEQDHYIGSVTVEYIQPGEAYTIAERIANERRAHLHSVHLSCFICMESFADEPLKRDPDTFLPMHTRCESKLPKGRP